MKSIIGTKSAFIAVVMALFATACVNPTSYVDPAYGKVSYEDLTRRAVPYQWRLKAEFQRNGVGFPKVDGELLGHVERVVRASGMAVPTSDAVAPELKVIVNNVADVGQAAAKGFGTGLTFGLAGSQVTDFYEMEIVFADGDKVIKKSGYKHALHSTIGNARGPAGLTPMTVSEAFAKVVEQLVLNALKDIETEYGAPAKGVPISLNMLAIKKSG